MKKVKKKFIKNKEVNFSRVHKYVADLFSSDIHASRVISISNAVLGVMTAASLAISMIGLGLSVSKGNVTKHAVKQVDRLIGNAKFVVWFYFECWIKELIGVRKNIVVAMDWTEFAKDNHSTLALYLVTNHGRAVPLIWKTYDKSTLKGSMAKYEKKILTRLKKLLPVEVQVMILADRGFGYVELYRTLNQLGFDFVIRFKGTTRVYDNKGKFKSAKEWIGINGRSKRLLNAKVTASSKEAMPVVVCTQDKKMKEPWCLVSNKDSLKTREIINIYGKRWSIETTFRDQKDIRFGMGMYNIKVSTPIRRDRLFFIAAMSSVFLTILGAASEATGMDRMLKANTVKRRTHSLFKQGLMLYDLLPNMNDRYVDILMTKFDELLLQRKLVTESLSYI